VIADIHFQPKYVFAAIDAGCAAVRVNPGNIKKFDDQVKEIARAAKDRGTSIRIGVNAGSLDKRLLEKYGKATPEALVESAVWEASLFEEHGFQDFKISRRLEIVSCPSCGRAQVDVYKLAEEVTAGLEGMEVPLRVAVMGCVVNGPGEAREADLGVASGNGKGQIFVKGEVIKTVPESQIVETLIEEAMRLAEQMEDVAGAEPVVSVS
jgi:4-hydroxy-3-methylbut-2-en-1-yl diphosphate synthase IspG/GcpE